MTTTYVTVGELDTDAIGQRWVLVLGGVTRVGNRRARRAATEALQSEFDVVWFDGFEAKHPMTNDRVELELEGETTTLHVVGFGVAEVNTLAGRLRLSKALQTNPVVRVIWRYLLRRLGTFLRARTCWGLIRPDVRRLSDGTPPSAIVFGDDYSITSAWYAGRIWDDVPLATSLNSR